ncbi:MAG: peptide deformylase [Kiritimatiellaeota bacterium]|nr:peptide deformylase [Kiritimatiellota bacterium]
MSIFRKKRLRIRIYGETALRKTAAEIAEIDDKIKTLAEVMINTMRSADGVGLAAPQVGESVRMCVLDVPSRRDASALSQGEMSLLPKMPIVLVNPEVLPTTKELVTTEEGCLSVPKIYAPVTRPARIMLTARTLTGELLHVECAGLLSKAVQHEVDHLNGILFPDKLEADEMSKIAGELKKLRKTRGR